MQRFLGAHSCVDGAGHAMDVGVPTFGNVGRCGVESVISFVVERDCLETVLSFFDIRA